MNKKVLLSAAVCVTILGAMLGWQQRSEAIPSRTQFNARVVAGVWENFNTTRDKTGFVGTGRVIVGHHKAIISIPTITKGADQISFNLDTLASTYSGSRWNGEGEVTVTVGGNTYTIDVRVTLRLQKQRDGKWIVTVTMNGGRGQVVLRVRLRGVNTIGATI